MHATNRTPILVFKSVEKLKLSWGLNCRGVFITRDLRCLVLLQCFVSVQNVLCRYKMFCASPKCFVPAQKPILLNANHFWTGTKHFGLAQNILDWHKTFCTDTKHFVTCKRTRHQPYWPKKATQNRNFMRNESIKFSI